MIYWQKKKKENIQFLYELKDLAAKNQTGCDVGEVKGRTAGL